MKKKAFTIAEFMICMALIGVITLFGMHTLNSRSRDFTSEYFIAYNALAKATYNVLADLHCKEDTKDSNTADVVACRNKCIHDHPINPEQSQCIENCSVDICKQGRGFPDNPRDLCIRYADYLNAAEQNIRCKDEADASYTPVNDNASNINNYGNDEKNNPLAFVLSNSMKFYISNKYEITDFGTSERKKITYYVVYVDLNGREKPNTTILKDDGSLPPDIVPFVITSKGEVIPIGYPIYSKYYVTARVVYPYKYSGDPSNETKYSDGHSLSMTFNEAIRHAFGCNEYYDMVGTVKFTERLLALFPNNVALKFLKDKNLIPTCQTTDIESAKGCKDGTFNCGVDIDHYKEQRLL